MTRKLPAELRPEDVVAIVDSREQDVLDLAPLRTTKDTLATGDYSVVGLESQIAIERKSLPDLLACCGQERSRFEKEMLRLLAYPVRALVIEGDWLDLERGDWRSQVTSASVIGSCLGWIAQGVPILLAGDHQRAGKFVSRMLYIAARRRWRENRALMQHVIEAGDEVEQEQELNA